MKFILWFYLLVCFANMAMSLTLDNSRSRTTEILQNKTVQNVSSICVLFNGTDCKSPRKSSEMMPNLDKFTIFHEALGFWKGWAYTFPLSLMNANNSIINDSNEIQNNNYTMALNYLSITEQNITYSENANQSRIFLTVPLKYLFWPCQKSEYPCSASQYLESINSIEEKANYTSAILGMVSSLPDQSITIENCLVYVAKHPKLRLSAAELICLTNQKDLIYLQKAISFGFKQGFKNIDLNEDVELLCEKEINFKVLIKSGNERSIPSSISFGENGLIFPETNRTFLDYALIKKDQFASTCGLDYNPITKDEDLIQVFCLFLF